jgi:hypothetical protein
MPSPLCKVKGCLFEGRYCRIHSVQTFKPIAAPKKTADSQKEAQKQYKKIARQYITTHPKCQTKGCKSPSECVHHKKGRVGDLLLDTKYFMAVCLDCHRKIEENPDWAKENNYSLSRLNQQV